MTTYPWVRSENLPPRPTVHDSKRLSLLRERAIAIELLRLARGASEHCEALSMLYNAGMELQDEDERLGVS